MIKNTLKLLTVIFIIILLFAVYFVYTLKQINEENPVDSNLVSNVIRQDEVVIEQQPSDIEEEVVVKDEVVEEKPRADKKILYDVPFIVQATTNQWKDSRFQDACEETSTFMAIAWARNIDIIQEDNTHMVEELAAWQDNHYGDNRDTSARDTVDRLYRDFYNYQHVSVEEVLSYEDILFQLEEGNIVVLPTNGQALKNPYFTQPGPERHMLVVRGYDYETNEFITNDPGIGKGEMYRYDRELLFNAVRDYVTGYHEPFPEGDNKGMIVVQKK